MAAQLICNQWVAGSTPVTSSKKNPAIYRQNGGVYRGIFAFLCAAKRPESATDWQVRLFWHSSSPQENPTRNGEDRHPVGFFMEKNGGSISVHPRKAAVYTATTSSRVGVIWLVDMQVSCSASSASAAKSAGSTLFSCARLAGMPTPALS